MLDHPFLSTERQPQASFVIKTVMADVKDPVGSQF